MHNDKALHLYQRPALHASSRVWVALWVLWLAVNVVAHCKSGRRASALVDDSSFLKMATVAFGIWPCGSDYPRFSLVDRFGHRRSSHHGLVDLTTVDLAMVVSWIGLVMWTRPLCPHRSGFFLYGCCGLMHLAVVDLATGGLAAVSFVGHCRIQM